MTTQDAAPQQPENPDDPDTPDTPQQLPPERVVRMRPDELVEAYAGLVKGAGQELAQQLGCPSDLQDLISWGYQGLLEAHERFDPTMEVCFSSFAFYRIRGAMYDGLRATGWAMRGTAIELRDAISINDYLESNLLANARIPRAKSFATSVTYLDRMVGDCVTICLLQSADLEQLARGQKATQGRHIERRETAQALQDAIEQLSENEQQVLLSYYVEDKSMTEIGEEMGYSKSWVSRINARVIDKLRRILLTDDPDRWRPYMTRV